MSQRLQQVVLVRHGETVWSISGRHTGLTDLPLTEKGERDAILLKEKLDPASFQAVLCSPLTRARETCELAGFTNPTIVDELREWDYGAYEGLTSETIRKQVPGWSVFRDGCPGGEMVDKVIARADRAVQTIRNTSGNVLVFSHGHFSRVLTARWCGLGLDVCRHLTFSTTCLSMIGYDRSPEHPAILSWNVRDLQQAGHALEWDTLVK